MSDKQKWKILSQNGERYLYSAVIRIGEFNLNVFRHRDDVNGAGAEMGDSSIDLGDLTLEQAQAAALAWARSVPGKALLEAGAETMTLCHCKKCGETRDSESCFCINPDFEKTIAARVEGD